MKVTDEYIDIDIEYDALQYKGEHFIAIESLIAVGEQVIKELSDVDISAEGVGAKEMVEVFITSWKQLLQGFEAEDSDE